MSLASRWRPIIWLAAAASVPLLAAPAHVAGAAAVNGADIAWLLT